MLRMSYGGRMRSAISLLHYAPCPPLIFPALASLRSPVTRRCLPRYYLPRSLSSNHQQSSNHNIPDAGGNPVNATEEQLCPPPRWYVSLTRMSPAWVEPYLRLARIDRPAGTLLLLYPGLWGIAAAATASDVLNSPSILAGFPDPQLVVLFTLGAFVMRGAGCTINDIWDRDFDRRVERTKTRPLASGELSVQQAIGFLALQLSTGLGVLLCLNYHSQLLGVASLGLVTLYPLAKRITHLPQIMLGLTFNWGVWMGYVAAIPRIPSTTDLMICLPLYCGGIAWTLVYDTIYAHQDSKDDQLLGLGSTAILFGSQTRSIITTLSLATSSMVFLSGFYADMPSLFYVIVASGGLHLTSIAYGVNIENRRDCLKRFKDCRHFGAIVLIAFIVGSWIKSNSSKNTSNNETHLNE